MVSLGLELNDWGDVTVNLKTRLIAHIAFAVLAAASFAPAQSAQNIAPQDLDAFAARVLKEFEVPGLAVAIVKDGKVVLAKGFGVRKLGEPTPVDENALFGIASNTKAFTSAALAMLVDEGLQVGKVGLPPLSLEGKVSVLKRSGGKPPLPTCDPARIMIEFESLSSANWQTTGRPILERTMKNVGMDFRADSTFR